MSIFTRFISWFKSIIAGIPKEIREYSAIALEVTTKIRHAIDNPITVSVVNLTPTNIDNEVREKLVLCLDVLIQWLEVKTLEDAIETMKLMPKKLQNATLIKMASEIVACLDNHEMQESHYDVAVQNVYTASKVA